MVRRERCPVCDGVAQPAGYKVGRYRARPYALAACAACGAAWVVDADDDFDQLYDAAYYEGRGADPLVDYASELTDPQTARTYEWNGLVQIARDAGVPPGARWVDFGGGAGGFARFLRTAGFEAWAYDTGRGIGIASEHGVPVLTEAELAALDGSVDVVSAIEVVEHVIEPLPLFARLAALLRPTGLLLLTTGNVERHRGPLPRWGYVMPEVHVTFFAPRTLERIYTQTGLEAVALPRSRGWDAVVRYKVLKTLGVHRTGWLERLVPWHLVAPRIDQRRGVSAMPSARKRR